MIINVEKSLFKKMFGETESLIKAIDIGSIWDDRWLILGSIIQDDLIKQMKFVPDGERYCYKKINDKIGDKLKFTFIYDPDLKKVGDTYVFGFSYDSINQRVKRGLMELLDNISFESDSIESDFIEKAVDTNGWLIVRKFGFLINKTYQQISNDVLQIFKLLIKEKQKIIKLFE